MKYILINCQKLNWWHSHCGRIFFIFFRFEVCRKCGEEGNEKNIICKRQSKKCSKNYVCIWGTEKRRSNEAVYHWCTHMLIVCLQFSMLFCFKLIVPSYPKLKPKSFLASVHSCWLCLFSTLSTDGYIQ